MPSPFIDDYYAILGVGAAADDQELRRAWRHLAARWHPDRAGAGATATFQQLSAAYTVLSDPVARAAYDRRWRGRRRAADSNVASGACSVARKSPPPSPRRQPAPEIMLSRLTGSLSSLLARGAARVDEEAGFITLVLRTAEAAQGGMVRVSLHVDLWCPQCTAQKRSAAGCVCCGGKGTVEELYSAWLAVPPGVAAGEVLAPSVKLPGMVEPVRFRVRLAATR